MPAMKFTPSRAARMAQRPSVIFPSVMRRKEYSDEWYTPDHIPAALGPFDLDPAAGPKNHAIENIRRPRCGLAEPWSGRVWLNPPYSNVHEWMARFQAHANGICLVNARPETHWFQSLVSSAAGCLWLKARVNFETEGGKARRVTVGSVLVAYGEHNAEALRASALPGVFMRVAARPLTNDH
jgi:hypothetical protein